MLTNVAKSLLNLKQHKMNITKSNVAEHILTQLILILPNLTGFNIIKVHLNYIKITYPLTPPTHTNQDILVRRYI